MAKIKDYRYNGKAKAVLSECPTDADGERANREALTEKTEENMMEMAALQEKLYADGRESLVIVLQAMDAAGKDSVVKNVMRGLNPQGVEVVSFKAPNAEELSHGYLWRVARRVPPRGMIAIFNRSHYEDVLVVRVKSLHENMRIAPRCVGDDLYENRFRQIRDFERYLYENGCRMVKIFLHVSAAEQKRRLLDRMDRPDKQWKFSPDDLAERARWDKYQEAYQDAINATATKHAPWYVVPADDKWYTRYLVSEIVLKALKKMDPQYPPLAASVEERLPEYRKALTDQQ